MIPVLLAICWQNEPFTHALVPVLEASTLVRKGESVRLPVSFEHEWNEMVLSWDARLSPGASVRFDVQLGGNVFCLGEWATPGAPARGSKSSEIAGVGRVDTDTLVLDAPATRFEIVATATGGEVTLESLHAALVDTRREPATLPPNRAVWGKTIEVPKRAQMSYPNGGVLCSPTSVSMVLAYWAQELGRPSLDRDVPKVETNVYDPHLPGCGNWPFNAAYAASLPGMSAVVARLPGIRDLEDLIEQGFPVICSVKYTLLQGKAPGTEDGHLVVLVGFTETGDPVFNDPGRNVVRRIYRREDFEKAWRVSQRTVYLIWPTYGFPSPL